MKVKKLAQMGALAALSVLGSFLKIPSMVGTLAFDSLPGYFAALCISPETGALVAGLGHAATATINGLPMGLPLHALIALGMMAAAYGAGITARRGRILGGIVGVVVNGVALPAIFIPLPGFGLPFFLAAAPSILLASLLNVAGALALSALPALRGLLHGQ